MEGTFAFHHDFRLDVTAYSPHPEATRIGNDVSDGTMHSTVFIGMGSAGSLKTMVVVCGTSLTTNETEKSTWTWCRA